MRIVHRYYRMDFPGGVLLLWYFIEWNMTVIHPKTPLSLIQDFKPWAPRECHRYQWFDIIINKTHPWIESTRKIEKKALNNRY